VVKTALNRHTARLLPVQTAQSLIRDRAEAAVKRLQSQALKPYRVDGPVTFELDFKTTDSAHMASLFDCVKRVGPKTVVITAADYPTAFKHLWGAMILGAKTMGGVL